MTFLVRGVLMLCLMQVVCSVAAGSVQTFSPTGSISTERYGHTATKLRDGRVLIAGGYSNSGFYRSIADLYDPATRTFTRLEMRYRRAFHAAVLLQNGKVLIVGGLTDNDYSLASAEMFDPATRTFSEAGWMASSRADFSAMLLPDGRVLVAGGAQQPSPGRIALATAELWNPGSLTFSQTGAMTTARWGYAVTLLASGKVLISGGENPSGSLASAELYDPAAGTFTPAASMITKRAYHSSTALLNGKVLIAGGNNGTSTQSSAELYDLAAAVFTATSSMAVGRRLHTATSLPGGKVLITGGTDGASSVAGAEIYNPATGAFSVTGSMNTGRAYHTATLLDNATMLHNSQVLVVGGASYAGPSSTPLRSAELYQPALEPDTFSPTGNLTTARYGHTATKLPNGKVLVAGGYGPSGCLSSAELYDPATGLFDSIGMRERRAFHAATLLPNGKVLLVGGIGDNGYSLASAELFDPNTAPGYSPFSAGGWMNSSRADFTATLLPDGKVLVAGGQQSPDSIALATAELYDPVTATFTQTGAMATARWRYTASLLANGKVLITGGENPSGILASSELYDLAVGMFSPAASMTTKRIEHTSTRLLDGKVLMAGGWSGIYTTIHDTGGGFVQHPLRLQSAELYDPDAGIFVAGGSMARARGLHTATLLPHGTVLVAGGVDDRGNARPGELYEPTAVAFGVTASMNTARFNHTGTLLDNGKVLIVGGGTVASGAPLASAELYQPAPVSISFSPLPNAAGWNNRDVTVTISALDTRPGAVSMTYEATGAQAFPPTTAGGSTATALITREGQTTLTARLTDAVGNTTTQVVVVKLDKTRPDVTPLPPDPEPASGWYATNVSRWYRATDALSGLKDPAQASFALATNVPAGAETATAATDTRTVCDAADNCTGIGPLTFRVDRRSPTIYITSPGTNAQYSQNQALSAQYSCSDGGSGITLCTGPVPPGTALDTSTVGQKTFGSVEARDAAGNSTSAAQFTYYIVDTTPPRLVAGPTVRGITANSAEIAWSTDEPASAEVLYGRTTSYGATASFSPAQTFRVQLASLEPNTLYHYRIRLTDLAGNVFHSGDFTFTTGNTPTGSGVVVIPADAATGQPAPVTLTFSNVVSSGTTTVTSTTVGHGAPRGFRIATSPPTYYDISTTAQFAGPVQVCFSYAGLPLNSDTRESNLRLMHFESAWVNVSNPDTAIAANPDTTRKIICGTVSSLSPFALMELINRPPAATAVNVSTRGNNAVAITLAGTDADGDALTFQVAAQPSLGTVSGSGANLTYTPATNFIGTDTFSFTASDYMFQSAPAIVSIRVYDDTPPQVTAVLSQAPNAAGWHSADVTVSWNTADPESGVPSITGCGASAVSTETTAAGLVYTCMATNGAGLQQARSVTIKLDKTPPVITPAVTPAPNAAGWNNADTTVAWLVQDSVSGIAESTGCAPGTITTETAGATITCLARNAAGLANSASVLVRMDKTAPRVIDLMASPNPVAVNNANALQAMAADSGGSGLASVLFSIEGVPAETMTAGPSGYSATLPLWTAASVQTICAHALDRAGNSGPQECTLLAVYDPAAGFVTGGGWIDSPAGAYTANPALIGRASFGFVSRYQRGATTPSGQTEFQFRVASFNFHSSNYEWLVVSGARAQYKGRGTVNGTGNYGFLLTATDGQVPGGGGVDKFRIKIWDRATGAVIYDNVATASDDIDSANPQVIGGGSIVIHRE